MAVQVDRDDTDLLPFLEHVVNRHLHDREACALDDDALCVLRAVVLKDLVAARELAVHVHELLDYLPDLHIVRV